MKRILTSFALVAASLAFSQVSVSGDDNHTPEATLDVRAIDNGTTPDGVLIPRVTKAKAESMPTPQKSTLVYINDQAVTASGGAKTADVDAEGFYYFDGNKWVKLSGGAAGADTSLYTADGSINGGDRVVTQNNNNLTFNTGTGALEINGNSKLMGASYVNTVVVGSGTSYTVLDTDYYVSVSSPDTNTGGQFDVFIPAAAPSNKGRVLIISNRTGAANLKLLVSGTTDQQIINGSESEVIPNDKAEWIVSDGTKWFNLINY